MFTISIFCYKPAEFKTPRDFLRRCHPFSPTSVPSGPIWGGDKTEEKKEVLLGNRQVWENEGTLEDLSRAYKGFENTYGGLFFGEGWGSISVIPHTFLNSRAAPKMASKFKTRQPQTI